MDERKKVELKHKRQLKAYLKRFPQLEKGLDVLKQKLELEQKKLEEEVNNLTEKIILGGGV